MTPQNILLIGFAVTVAFSLIIGSWGRRRSTGSLVSFFWGDNNFNVSQGTHLNLSTGFAINGILYSAWLGYKAGWASLLPQVVWCAGYIFLGRYAARLGHLARTGTLHGNIGLVFGKWAAIWAAVASVVGFTLLFGWELFVGASLFKAVTPSGNLDVESILYFSLAGIAAIYCMLGGLRGNLHANQFQNVLSAVAVVVGIGYLWWFAKGTQPFAWHDLVDVSTLSSLATELTVAGIITNLVLFAVYQFIDMSVWQNIAAVSDEGKKPKRVLWASALWVFIFPGLTGSALGMLMRSVHSGIDSNSIVPRMLEFMANQPAILLLMVMGFFAMMLSTVDGLLLAAAQAVTWDLIDRKAVKQILERRAASDDRRDNATTAPADHPASQEEAEEQESNVLNHARYGILAIAAIGGAITLALVRKFGVNSFNLLYIAYVGQMSLFPAVWVILHGEHRPQRRGALSIGVGLLAGFVAVAYGLTVEGSTIATWAPTVALGVACLFYWPFRKVAAGNSGGET